MSVDQYTLVTRWFPSLPRNPRWGDANPCLVASGKGWQPTLTSRAYMVINILSGSTSYQEWKIYLFSKSDLLVFKINFVFDFITPEWFAFRTGNVNLSTKINKCQTKSKYRRFLQGWPIYALAASSVGSFGWSQFFLLYQACNFLFTLSITNKMIGNHHKMMIFSALLRMERLPLVDCNILFLWCT